jgi:hypothetical protein
VRNEEINPNPVTTKGNLNLFSIARISRIKAIEPLRRCAVVPFFPTITAPNSRHSKLFFLTL